MLQEDVLNVSHFQTAAGHCPTASQRCQCTQQRCTSVERDLLECAAKYEIRYKCWQKLKKITSAFKGSVGVLRPDYQ